MISHEAEWKLKKIPPKQTTKDTGKDRKCKMDFFFSLGFSWHKGFGRLHMRESQGLAKHIRGNECTKTWAATGWVLLASISCVMLKEQI